MDDLVKRLRDCEFMGMPDARLDYSTAHEAAARIEALEAQVRAADALADALESSGNVTERHCRAMNALVAYRATKEGGA